MLERDGPLTLRFDDDPEVWGSLVRDEDEPEYRDKTLAKSVLGRAGGLDELQRAVDYLLDSHYVTGRVLPMDGGRHVA